MKYIILFIACLLLASCKKSNIPSNGVGEFHCQYAVYSGTNGSTLNWGYYDIQMPMDSMRILSDGRYGFINEVGPSRYLCACELQ